MNCLHFKSNGWNITRTLSLKVNQYTVGGFNKNFQKNGEEKIEEKDVRKNKLGKHLEKQEITKLMGMMGRKYIEQMKMGVGRGNGRNTR